MNRNYRGFQQFASEFVRGRNIQVCGVLAKSRCDYREDIEKQFFDKNVFLDIPYSNYSDCDTVLIDLLKEVGLIPIIAKEKLTSNDLLCKVCRQIRTCKYGVTDISTGSNSVSYEYGLMHGYGMKVCLLRREDSAAFTDIKGLDHIPYQGIRTFRIKIAQWIEQNIPESNKERIHSIVSGEEKALKEKGDVQLIQNKPDSTKKEKENQSVIPEVINNGISMLFGQKFHKCSHCGFGYKINDNRSAVYGIGKKTVACPSCENIEEYDSF